jgi:hypothetical protein
MAAGVRERIEASLGEFGRKVVRHARLATASMLVLALGLILQLPPSVETAVENFLVEDDPGRILYQEFKAQFGRGDVVIVAVRPPDVFDRGFLARLHELHRTLEDEVPHLDEVQSLLNARSTRGEADELIVEDLLEALPETPEQMAVLRERVLGNPFYRNTLISEDGRFTALMITIDLYDVSGAADDGEEDFHEGFGDAADEPGETDDDAAVVLDGEQVGETVDRIRELVLRFDAPDFETWIAGAPVLQQQVVKSMQRDFARFVTSMLLAVGALLYWIFRRASGVFLPLLAVLLALASTVGAMAASGTPVMPPTQILPTFLLAVGVGTAIHVLKMFYLYFDAGESVEEAVGHAFSHAGLAILMTAATTAGGLFSFRAAGIAPVEDLGIFGPLGVVLVVVYSLVLVPALLALLPLQRRAPLPESAWMERMGRLIVRAGALSAHHPFPVLLGTAAIVVFSAFGIARLHFTNDIMSWLPPSDPLRRATEVIDAELRGSMTLEVISDTGVDDGVKQPDFLQDLEVLRLRVQDVRRGDHLYVGRSISVADVVKEIHQALNENRPDFYRIPDDAQLVAQELLLFENAGSDDLEDLVDTRFRMARFTLKVPYVDPLRYDGFVDEVEAEFRAVLPPTTAIRTTGFMAMISETVLHVIHGLASSYVLALAIITPVMMLLLGSLRTGLASMVPNLSPILLTLGVMGYLGVTIDMFTMMIGSIAMGLVVDDTIHFMHGFRRLYAQTGDTLLSIRGTLETTGQALLFTSVVLSLGFSVFALSEMRNLFYFGLFTSFTIATAFLLDILVSPALMVLVTRRGRT